MEKELSGGMVTYDTRRESYEKVDKRKRYAEIEYILSRFPNGLTAKQIAVQMKKLGYTNNDERNNSAPRLSELAEMGKVKPTKKTKCEYTGKTVSVYQLIKEPKQMTLTDFID